MTPDPDTPAPPPTLLVISPMPPYAARPRPWQLLLALTLCVAAALATRAGAMKNTSPQPVQVLVGCTWAVAVLMSIGAAAEFQVVFRRGREARSLAGHAGGVLALATPMDSPRRFALLSVLSAEGPLDSDRVVQRRWHQAFAGLPAPHPPIVADRFISAIDRLEQGRTERLRPWPALGALTLFLWLVGTLGIVTVSAAIVDAYRIQNIWPVVAVGIVTSLALLAILSPNGRRFLMVEGRSLHVSPGAVRDHRGRCWTPYDSQLVIAPAADRGATAMARLVGSAGVRCFCLRSLKSSEATCLLGAWCAAGSATAAASSEAPSVNSVERILAGEVSAATFQDDLPAATADSEQRPEDEQAIPVMPLPALAPQSSGRAWVGLALILLSAIAIPVLMITRTDIFGVDLRRAWGFGIGVIVASIINFARTLMAPAASRGAAARIALDPAAPLLSRAVSAAATQARAFRGRAARDAVWSEWVARLKERPIAVMAPALAPGLRRLGRTHVFLEPHTIRPGDRSNMMPARAMGLAAMAGVLAMMGSRLLSIVLAILACLQFLRIPAIWYRLKFLHMGGGTIVAGPGWVRDSKDRIWTVRDSVMLAAAAAGGAGFLIRIVGPAGCCDLRFSSTLDAELIALWRLWTHRDPRPELAAPEPVNGPA